MTKFKFYNLPLDGMKRIEYFDSSDNRGKFQKIYASKEFQREIPFELKETLVTYSKANVIRGLHFQIPPQAKIISCLKGAIFDVGVDLRRGSPSFGQWYGEVLTESDNHSLFIPHDFAHGYAVLKDSIVVYLCDEDFSAEGDSGVYYLDSDINVDWGIIDPNTAIVSEKDSNLKSLKELINLGII